MELIEKSQKNNGSTFSICIYFPLNFQRYNNVSLIEEMIFLVQWYNSTIIFKDTPIQIENIITCYM